MQGANFSTLTLSGANSPGGIGGWGIRDLTIDGNKANQSAVSYGLRVYGYNFDLHNIDIQNCYSDGLYTEWGSWGDPSPDGTMEAHYYGLKILNNNGNGWLNRGPHDSRAYDITCYNNGLGAANTYQNYWGDECATARP